MKKKIWKFSLFEDFSTDLKRFGANSPDIIFYDLIDENWQVVGEIKSGVLRIYKGYEWNGCSPKFRVFGKIVGILDFNETWEASLVHDFLLEYCSQHDIPRKIIDNAFEIILAEKKFRFRWIYANGVHLFRPISLKLWPCRKLQSSEVFALESSG